MPDAPNALPAPVLVRAKTPDHEGPHTRPAPVHGDGADPQHVPTPAPHPPGCGAWPYAYGRALPFPKPDRSMLPRERRTGRPRR